MNRAEVCRYIEEIGIVPVVRAPSPAMAERAAEALMEGGISVLEITLTVPGAVGVIRSLCARLGGRAVVGAGTVLAAADAKACIDAGAAFVVTPGLDVATIETAHAAGVPALAGALTPTEIMAAMKANADMVKIFPCSAVGGAKYLRAVRGPLPNVKLLPTGGVSLENVAEYLAAGATAVGMGSELVDLKALDAGKDTVITEKARQLRHAVLKARTPAAS